MAKKHCAYIGLGSNLEHPLKQVQRAIREIEQLKDTKLVAISSWYQSRAVGPGQQPDYINGVAKIQTTLSPLALLDKLQTIEKAHHRVRIEHWGPRTLDLDILLYDQECISHPRLTIPHPRILERNFVVVPLAELDANLMLPQRLTNVDNMQNSDCTEKINKQSLAPVKTMREHAKVLGLSGLAKL